MNKKILILLIALTFTLTSCKRIPFGHRGVEVSWGGKTNMDKVYNEGVHWGLHWCWDKIIPYDVREKTIVLNFEFNDLKNMITGIKIAVDYNYKPNKVNSLHAQITDIEEKLVKTIASACKEVIPSYTAVDLNLNKRAEAEDRLTNILTNEFSDFFFNLVRVQLTDVDIPKSISDQAELTAEQIEKNKLAAEKAEEQENLGKAQVAKSKADAEAAEYDAKAAKLRATPEQLKLKQLEIEMKWAEKGKSPYGENNVFGSDAMILKNFNNN